MNSSVVVQKRPFPTLRTVLLVERFLVKHQESLFSKAAIIRGLQGQVNNASLSTILEYLEASNKVLQGPKGIQWIAGDAKKMKVLMKDALLF